MKRFLVLMSILLVLCLVFVSCGEDTSEGGSSSEQGSVADSVGGDSSKTESGTPDGGVTDSSTGGETPDDGNTDKSSSAGTDGSTDLSSGTENGSADNSQEPDSSVNSGATDESGDIGSNVGSEDNTQSSEDKPQPPIDEPPIDEPPVVEPPVEEPDDEEDLPDGPIDIVTNGATEYTVVYEADNIRVKEFTDNFLAYMKDTHGIELEAVSENEAEGLELCIYIGHVKGTKKVRGRLNAANDFGACVSGNDYVLYATNDRLYEFLYDVLVEDVLFLIRNKTWSTAPKKDFIYSQSKYKDVRYVDYLLEKQGEGITRRYFLTKIFEDRTYTASDGTVIPYRLYVPYDYDRTKEYPVLLHLHGAGERGSENLNNLTHMFEILFAQENSPLWDSIIIAPQCPADQQWVDTPWRDGGYRVDEVPESNELKTVLEILELVKASFPTDLNRYYVTGISMGGFGAWDLIMRHSEMFAAAIPICGGGDYKQAHKLVDMPIWTFHDKRDADVPVQGTRDMVVALETLGSTVIYYEELNRGAHNVWDHAASQADIWKQLFLQTREGR